MSNNKGNKMKIKTILMGCLFFCVSFLDLFGQSSRGEKAFLENNPEEAILFLEEEINSGTASSKAYNFLGLAYFQLGNFEESIKAFEKGLKVPTTNKKIIAYNQGNTYYKMGKYLEAADAFSLAYSADSSFTDALLNRANAYLMAQKYQETINDYTKYLYLCPEDEQCPQIEQILALLQQEIVRQAEEEKRLAEEVIKFIHSEEAYNKAVRITEALFKGNEVKQIELNKNIVDILVDLNAASSKREAREFINNSSIIFFAKLNFPSVSFVKSIERL